MEEEERFKVAHRRSGLCEALDVDVGRVGWRRRERRPSQDWTVDLGLSFHTTVSCIQSKDSPVLVQHFSQL